MKTNFETTLYALFLSIFFVFVVSCRSHNNKNIDITETSQDSVAVISGSLTDFNKDTSLLSEIDFSSINSPEDYIRVKNNLIREYISAEENFYENYLILKIQAFKVYSDREKQALAIFRESNEEDYMEWLDAEKTRDYERLSIAEEAPSYIKYKLVKDREYSVFKETEKDLYEAYLQKRAELHKELERKSSLIYFAYKNNN